MEKISVEGEAKNEETGRMSTLVSGFEKRLERDLPAKVGAGLIECTAVDLGSVAIRAERDSVLRLCKLLKESYGFDHLSLISALDWIERFELVYHITSYDNNCRIILKVSIPKDDPQIDSIANLWGGANWHEREAYDMMGIVFTDHPDPRRILLPQDYKYFPLRKDFKME